MQKLLTELCCSTSEALNEYYISAKVYNCTGFPSTHQTSIVFAYNILVEWTIPIIAPTLKKYMYFNTDEGEKNI